MRWIALAALTTSIAFSVAASADDPKPQQRLDIPDGVTVTKKNLRDLDFEQVEAYKCFKPDEYEVVARIVIDYRWFWDYSIAMEQMQRNYEAQIANLEIQRQLWEDTTARVDESRLLAVKLLKEERSAKLEFRMSTKLRLWVTGSLAVVSAVVAGIFGGAYAATK